MTILIKIETAQIGQDSTVTPAICAAMIKELTAAGYPCELAANGDNDNDIPQSVWDACLSRAIDAVNIGAQVAQTLMRQQPKVGDTKRTISTAALVYTTKYYYVSEKIYTAYKDQKRTGGYWRHNRHVMGRPGYGVDYATAYECCR